MQGNDYYLREAKQQVESILANTHYHRFEDVVKSYLHWFSETKPAVKTFDKEVVPQCRLLVELLGADTNIADINDHAAISDLKAKLRKYPLNKTKLFGDKALATIIRSGVDYRKISLETADKC